MKLLRQIITKFFHQNKFSTFISSFGRIHICVWQNIVFHEKIPKTTKKCSSDSNDKHKQYSNVALPFSAITKTEMDTHSIIVQFALILFFF